MNLLKSIKQFIFPVYKFTLKQCVNKAYDKRPLQLPAVYEFIDKHVKSESLAMDHFIYHQEILNEAITKGYIQVYSTPEITHYYLSPELKQALSNYSLEIG
jgi:hypothetical protein